NNRHPVYPVFNGKKAIGTISLWEIAQVPGPRWNSVKVGEVVRSQLAQAELDTDLREVVRLMNQHQRHRLVLIIDSDGNPAGLITPSDVVFALSVDHDQAETDIDLRQPSDGAPQSEGVCESSALHAEGSNKNRRRARV